MRVLKHVSCLAGVAGLMVALTAPDVTAGDNSGSGRDYYAGLNCAGLWYERNAIYARYGFCFESPRAQATFGRGCFAPYGRLPANLKRVVNHIERIERRRGC